MIMIEGTVPAGWTQAEHDAYWFGHHAGENHANYVEAYGATADTTPPLWVSKDETLLMRWQSGYGDGVEKDEQDSARNESETWA
jgi:hypothetical protein